MSGEVFRNTSLDARFKLKFTPNVVMATITSDTVYIINPSTGEKVECGLSKYASESSRPVTLGRKQIEVILTPAELLEKKTLYEIVASENILGFEGWGIINSKIGNTILADGFERGEFIPIIGQTVYINEQPHIVDQIVGTWENRNSVFQITFDREVSNVGDVLKFGNIIKLTKGDKIYTIETSGIITEFYPANGSNNVDKTIEIALATSESMSVENIQPYQITLHHVKWIDEYEEDLSRLGDVGDPNAFDFGEGKTIRWHEGHWADTGKESFHMIKYNEEDTYVLSDYDFTVNQWLEYNKNSWVKTINGVNVLYYYRLHQAHKWNDESHVVRYFYVDVPENNLTPPEEPSDWQSFDWGDISIDNLCEECELVYRTAESKRFRARDNAELIPSGNILNKNLYQEIFYVITIYRQTSERELHDGDIVEIQDPEGIIRGRFDVLLAQDDVITIFSADSGASSIKSGDEVYFVDPDFKPCTTCEPIEGVFEIQSVPMHDEEDYVQEPSAYDGNDAPTSSNYGYGPPWIRECNGILTYASYRWHQNHLADGHGDGWHLVSYVHPDEDPYAFNPYKCQCCELVNSYEVDHAFITQAKTEGTNVTELVEDNLLEKFLLNSNYHYMPNIKALFNYYEFKEDYSPEEWEWLSTVGFDKRPYPWKMNISITYQDNLGSSSVPVTTGSQYLIKIQPLTDMDVNWEKIEQMQTDFNDRFLEDIPFPKVLEPRHLLTGATYELFTSKDLESVEGIREGIDTITRFSVTPIIKSISPKPDDLNVLPGELITIELDGHVNTDTLTADTLKLYYKNTLIEVENYDVNYNNDTITVGAYILDVIDMGKETMTLSGQGSQYYDAEFISGNIRLLYANGERCGDYFIEYVFDTDPITGFPRYRIYVYLCEDRNELSITALPFLLSTGYSVKLAPELALSDGRILGYQKSWAFRTKQFIKWVSPVPDLENAPLTCDVWINFNYRLALYDNIFFDIYPLNENQVIGATSDTSRLFVISENDLLTLDNTPGKGGRTILEEHLGEHDLLKNYYKPGLITQINDTTSEESLIWMQFDSDFEPLTNYFIVIDAPIYIDNNQGYTKDPIIYRFATNRFVRWVNPSAYRENVPLNSRMYIQFKHDIVEDTLDSRSIYVDKMFPPITDPNPSERYMGPIAYNEESFRASFLLNMEVDQIDKDYKGKGKKTKESLGTFLNYPYNEDTRWLRLNITPNVVDYQGETLNANFESPFTFHPLIRELVPNFGNREVYCILDQVEIYSNVGNLIHWSQVITDFPPGTFDPPRPDYRKIDGTGTLTEEAKMLIYLENTSTKEKIYFDKIRQECSGTLNGYIGIPRIEAPSGFKQRTKLLCTWDNNEPFKLEAGQSYRIVISKDLKLNVGKDTGGLPIEDNEEIANIFNTTPPSVANNYGKDWVSNFRTSLIEDTYPRAFDKGVTLDVEPVITFAEPLDESTIINSRYEIYDVPGVKKLLSALIDTTTAVMQVITDQLELESKELYGGDLTGIMPINTLFTFSSYPNENFYVDTYVDSTTIIFSPEMPEILTPQKDDIVTFTPNRVRKEILTLYYNNEFILTRDYERGANVIYLNNDISSAVQRSYGITPKTLTELDIRIGSWFKVISDKKFENNYYITDIKEEGQRTRIEFWPRLETNTAAYDKYGNLLDQHIYLDIYSRIYPIHPTLSENIVIGDRFIRCTGFLNEKYLPRVNQWISFIDYSLNDNQLLDPDEGYLFRDGYAIAFQVISIECYRDESIISNELVTDTDTVVLKLRMASNFDLQAPLEILMVPMDYRYFATGTVYLKNNLSSEIPFVSGKISYDQDKYELTFIPDEPLSNSSIWIRNCDYDSLFYNYSLIITPQLKTITGASLLVPQEIPFKTWTYISGVSPEDGEKTMPIFGTVRVLFKQNMTFRSGGPASWGKGFNFYDPNGVPYSNSNPFPFLPSDTTTLSNKTYLTPKGGSWQLHVYMSPRFEEGIEVYDRLDDIGIMTELAKAGEYGEFINGRVGPTYNSVSGTPLLTWRRAERILSNNPSAAGESQYVYYSLPPDTLFKAVLRYKLLSPADKIEDQETGEDLTFDLFNSIKCRFWEDVNYTWFFKTDKLVYSIYPEKGEEEVFSDAQIEVVFIDLIDPDTLLMQNLNGIETIVPDTETFRETNTIYLWRDTSITHRDEAGNVLYVQKQRTQIPCGLEIVTTTKYTADFAGYNDDIVNEETFSLEHVYLSTGRLHRLYHKPRTVALLLPEKELLPGETYYVSVSDRVKTTNGIGYAEGAEFTSSFKTSEIIRSISILDDLTAETVYEWGYPPYQPKYIKIMFHKHMDAESLGAKEDTLAHDPFSRISIQRLPLDPVLSNPPSPRAHVSYRDHEFYGPVPNNANLVESEYCRNGEECIIYDDKAVNIWAEWRPFNARILEPSYRNSEIELQITLSSSIKSQPYAYNPDTGLNQVVINPTGGETIYSLPFGVQKIITKRIKFSGTKLVNNAIAMVYPQPQQFTSGNSTFDVFGLPRQFNQITASYDGELDVSLFPKPYYWPISLLNNQGNMIESADISFLNSEQRETLQLTFNQNFDRVLNSGTYDFLFWPKIKFRDSAGGINRLSKGSLYFNLLETDNILYLTPQQDLTGSKYLLIDRGGGPDPLMIEFSSATNVNFELEPYALIAFLDFVPEYSIIGRDAIQVSLSVYNECGLNVGDSIYFKHSSLSFYVKHTVTRKFALSSLRYIEFEPELNPIYSDAEWEENFYVEESSGTITIPLTRLNIVERIAEQTGTVLAETICYTEGYTVSYHINNLIEHVSMEWEKDRYIMWVIFVNGLTETYRPDYADLQTWYEEGRIYAKRGDTTYLIPIALESFECFNLGSNNVKAMKLTPKISYVDYLRRPWDPWPYGGFSQETNYDLFINKIVANDDDLAICDYEPGITTTNVGKINGNYSAGSYTINIDATPAPESNRHIMIDGWSYIIKSVSGASTPYQVLLTAPLINNITNEMDVYYDVVNFYNVDFKQTLLCPSYPALPPEPICKTSTEQGGCTNSSNIIKDAGVYSMDPAPYSDNVDVTTTIKLIFTDKVLAIPNVIPQDPVGEGEPEPDDIPFIGLYTVPEDLENFEGKEAEYLVDCNFNDIYEYENGFATKWIGRELIPKNQLLPNTEYFVWVKKSVTRVLGEAGIKLAVEVKNMISIDNEDHWLLNQAILREEIIGEDPDDNIKSIKTDNWTYQPQQGIIIRFEDVNNNKKMYIVDYVEGQAINLGNILTLHLRDKIYANHESGTSIDVGKELGTDEIEVFLSEDEVFSFITGGDPES